MIYIILKIVHVISACLLFGTGLGTAAYMYFAHKTKDIEIIAPALQHIVKGDWYFTLPSGLIQLVTGVLMVYSHHLSFRSLWIGGSLLGFIIAGACWLPVVLLQIQLREIAATALELHQNLPAVYYRKFRQWFWLGWPAFISLIVVFYLMANRPTFFIF